MARILKFQRRLPGHELRTADEHRRQLRTVNRESPARIPTWVWVALVTVAMVCFYRMAREPVQTYQCNLQRTECFWVKGGQR